MKRRYYALLMFVIVTASSGYLFAHISNAPPGTFNPEFKAPHKVLEVYFEAVIRGELIVFGKTLDKSMLVPIRIEYVYELDSAIPKVKVYSEIKQPIPVPEHQDCKVSGVSAILDNDGRIVESAAHIRFDQ